MYGYLLQDWITIRGTQTGVNIIQSEVDWLSLQPYQDVVMWLEVKSVTLGGLTSITLDYETAPAKDESLFVKMITTTNLTAAVSRQDKALLSAATVPLARYLRWKIIPNGTVSSEFGVCFRIYVAANAVGALA